MSVGVVKGKLLFASLLAFPAAGWSRWQGGLGLVWAGTDMIWAWPKLIWVG